MGLNTWRRYDILAWALGILCCTCISATATTPATERERTHSGSCHCRSLTFTVHATAVNKVIPSPAASTLKTQDGANAFLAGLPDLLASSTSHTRSGTYNLVAVYCQPRPPKGPLQLDQEAPLQILLHGSTYTKEHWDRGAWGHGDPKYSWTKAMNRNGYATLAVDKLGNGASSHPDPVYDVQLPLQIETVHSLILQIKSGEAGIPVLSSSIFVGHSSGSIFRADLAQTHPEDVDASILTGYPAGESNNKGGISPYHYLPAAISACT